jgi:RimJ/RimL family protein N-acetyltransferase
VNIETEGLILRALELKDASFLVELVNDPETREVLGAYNLVFPVSIDSEEKWISKVTERTDEAHMIITTRKGGRAIGILSVKDMSNKNASAHISIILERKSWDKGLGTEAVTGALDFLFNRKNTHRVWLRVDRRNARAIRCYEKCRFSMDGVLRDDHFATGAWQDSLIMSILADEFRRRSR